ncbi:DnaT-like ssDNA-binding protein [Chitinolyticbacter meiyuanensis]|uniref:DnaT-like ssDNA-binding protein n=1 Tax=Chitinolyticbacter meiyuanensis TaxID=682798 RepID=UPI0011E5D26E|nr:DnaT-like ssDNA-binding protein [Chitinolyticbacter meiyuanensis]
MALVIEDGTGRIDADSFVSVADADIYHSGRGNTAWASLTSDVKEQRLRNAASYLSFSWSYGGSLYNLDQALAFPRLINGVKYDVSGAPARVKQAQMELALQASLTGASAVGTAQVIRQKVDVIETEYAEGVVSTSERYPYVTNLLVPYLDGGPGQLKMVRA